MAMHLKHISQFCPLNLHCGLEVPYPLYLKHKFRNLYSLTDIERLLNEECHRLQFLHLKIDFNRSLAQRILRIPYEV